MTDSEKTLQEKSIWRSMLPGMLISLLALLVLFRLFDWQEVWLAVRQAEWGYLLLAVPFYAASYFLRALAWYLILQKTVPYRKVFFAMHTGYLLNNVLPFRLGELGRVYILGRDGPGFWRIFPSVLIERAFDMAFAAALLLGSLPFVLQTSNAQQVALIVGGVVVFGFVVLYLLARYRQWALKQFECLGERWPLILRLGKERFESFLEGLGALTSPGRFLQIFVLITGGWIFAVLIQFLFLRAFYANAKIIHATFALGVSAMGVAIPSSPGYVGVYEAAIVGALAVFGIPFSTAFAFAVTAHLAYVLITGVLGAYGLSSSNLSIGQIFQNLKRLKP
ncbi:MAG: flippase-like domain-containing protein [Chloroflexi bacterium]|jgi:uncharacterized protein (TIRG00374 family)|nr:flippase-like domain-containing protein [Chloroflexota bacterium]